MLLKWPSESEVADDLRLFVSEYNAAGFPEPIPGSRGRLSGGRSSKRQRLGYMIDVSPVQLAGFTERVAASPTSNRHRVMKMAAAFIRRHTIPLAKWRPASPRKS